MLERDIIYRDPLDRIDSLETRIDDLRDVSRPTEVVVVEQPEWQALAGWVSTGTVLRDVNGRIVLDPTEPMIEVGAGGYIRSSDYESGTSGFQITGEDTSEFNDVVIRGTIYAGSGEIGGFNIGTHTITADSSAVGLNSEVTGGTDWRIWAGHATPGSAPFRVDENGNLVATSATIQGQITATSGTIGGWTATANVLHSGNNITLDANDKSIWVKNETFGQAGIQVQWNSGTPRLYVGDGSDKYLKFDGEKVTVGGSLLVHGQIESAVLSYQAIQATSGSILITPSAGRLLNDATTASSPTTFDLDVEDPEYGHTQLFVAGDILRLRKIDGTENWVTVSSVTDNGTYYTYTCTMSNGSATTFSAGTPVLNYGQSGAGFLYMTSDDGDGPFYSVRTWETNPWTSGNVTERARIGNMRNLAGTGTNDRFGLFVGDYSSGNYLSYNAEAVGKFILSAANGAIAIDATGFATHVDDTVSGYGTTGGLFFKNQTYSATWGSIQCNRDYAASFDLTVKAHDVSGFINSLILEAEADSSTGGTGSTVRLYAHRGVDAAYFDLFANASETFARLTNGNFEIKSGSADKILMYYSSGDIRSVGGLCLGSLGQDPDDGEILLSDVGSTPSTPSSGFGKMFILDDSPMGLNDAGELYGMVPVGTIVPFGGSSAPAGWLLCDGSAVSRSTYSALFDVIGTTYGAGNGSTTFNLPDLQGRFPYGAESSTDHDLGETGGEASHTLTVSEMPSHNHSVTGGSHSHRYRQSTGVGGSDALEVNKSYSHDSGAIDRGSHSHSVGSAGGGGAHENRPPYLGVTFIIKT